MLLRTQQQAGYNHPVDHVWERGCITTAFQNVTRSLLCDIADQLWDA